MAVDAAGRPPAGGASSHRRARGGDDGDAVGGRQDLHDGQARRDQRQKPFGHGRLSKRAMFLSCAQPDPEQPSGSTGSAGEPCFFVGIDAAKLKHAVAIAEPGRNGEVRYIGEIEASAEAVRKLLTRLAARHGKLHVCYEAGPTGYGLYRQVIGLGHECTVVAPSLIPRRPGDRVKTNRRDAVQLARLLRAGELTAVWVPDEGHEAMRDLVRAREAAVDDLRRKRQVISSLLLKHRGDA